MSSYYEKKYDSESENILWVTVIFIIAIVIVLGVGIYRPFNKVSDMRDVTVTVTDKTVKNDGDDGKYLIFTEDKDGNIATFEITDSLIAGRFNSSDVYAAIKVDNTYTFTVGGSRNEFMSWYPNIYEYKLVEDEQVIIRGGKL